MHQGEVALAKKKWGADQHHHCICPCTGAGGRSGCACREEERWRREVTTGVVVLVGAVTAGEIPCG